MSGDEDIWASYAKGVQRLGEKEPDPVKKKRPAPRPKLDEEPLPAAWRGEGETEGDSGQALAQASRASEEALPELTPVAADPVPPTAPPQPVWKKEPLDLRVERNMSLGDVVIEAKLDLHGKTEQEAYGVFRDFIEHNHARGKRMLLVITGRGQDGMSVLRTNLPRWCDVRPFSDIVMAVRTAALHHGGDGAYYLLLRKRG